MSRPTPRSKAASPIRIAILGSTGSIGRQTLDIARLFPDRIEVVALVARSSAQEMVLQAREFDPECVVLVDEMAADHARRELDGSGVAVFSGLDGLSRVGSWPDVDVVVTAMVGAAGLLPTVAAVRAGRRVALANKETMVVAGDLIGQMARSTGAEIIPVDSEHSAIFQVLHGENRSQVDRLILTASGGPFLNRSMQSMADVRLEEALDHPNWSMGRKITIDSATMMNKGLEVIEARWLFDMEETHIDVVIHPQSIVHSMVTFVDGSSLAQLGIPDMKIPIQYALSWPERWSAPHPRVDWSQAQTLEFLPPDTERFPCLRLAYDALAMAGGAPTALNAANEVAVSLFLEQKLSFMGIPGLVERILEELGDVRADSIEARLDIDARVRTRTKELAREAIHYSGPVRSGGR